MEGRLCCVSSLLVFFPISPKMIMTTAKPTAAPAISPAVRIISVGPFDLGATVDILRKDAAAIPIKTTPAMITDSLRAASSGLPQQQTLPCNSNADERCDASGRASMSYGALPPADVLNDAYPTFTD